MGDPTAKFAVRLEDETSGPAKAAAESLANLKTQINEDTKALSEMQRALRRLKGVAGSGLPRPGAPQGVAAGDRRLVASRPKLASL